MKRSRPVIVSTIALATALVLAACGGDSDETGDGGAGGDGGLTEVRVGETAGIPSAFLEYGVDQGLFEEEGLDVQVDTSAGGAAAIPGVVGGTLDIAGSNTVSVLLAADQGLPVTMIAPGTFATEDPESDFSAVVVPADSDIETSADLAGRQVAVNTLQNIGDITISASVENAGADPSAIEYVELGFPDMLPALDSGQVEAAWVIEPFRTLALEAGDRVVSHPYVEAYPGLQVGSFLASDQYAAENPEVIDAFRAGLAATIELVDGDPDAFRSAVPDLDPEVADAMILPEYHTDIDVESLEFLAGRMLAEGYVSEEIDVESIVGEQ